MPDTVVPEELYSLVYHFLKDTDHPRTAAAFKNESKKPFHEIADLNYDLIKIFNDFKSEKTRRDVHGKDDTSSEESSPDSFSESISNDETLSQRTAQSDTSKLLNNDTTSDDDTSSSNSESDQDSSDDTSSSTKDYEKQNNGNHDLHHSESEDEKLCEEIEQKSYSIIENGEEIKNNENSEVQEISENNRTNGNNLKRRNDDLESLEQEHEYTFSPKKLNASQESEFFTRNSKNTNKFTRDSTNGHKGNKPNGFLKSTIGSYGQKAQKDFIGVRGKDFRAQKTKKKRGSYRGGKIDLESHSIKFD
ncbi:15613_t:CDS:2 [Acaulospora morrowiae]|uniref:15613_t:CDS:1 n=1 Tax=Acaulospora morrowiae TaxID=94023 RepID=A0A9N9E4P8_9GLOM|nr:15613_t:CDS:2 [Acaulospora morrowiae]